MVQLSLRKGWLHFDSQMRIDNDKRETFKEVGKEKNEGVKWPDGNPEGGEIDGQRSQ